MSNQELIRLIEQIAAERGIEADVLMEAVEAGIVSALRKRYGGMENLRARIDRETGGISVGSVKRVVEEVIDPAAEISLDEARAIRSEVQVGETLEEPVDAGDFSRIAAQTAKQIIAQRMREAERQMVYDEFKGREEEMVNGIVTRQEKGTIFVDLGKGEGILPRREQSFREVFGRGDRVRVYITEVKKTPKGTQIILSRTHPNLLIKLFEMEVPEIYEGIVQIKGAARDSAGRSKIAVTSIDKDVDPVGACVGMRGSRVQAVIQELRGEKIDIVEWDPDPKRFVVCALSPAKISRVHMNEAEQSMQVMVPDDQLSLAIGKKGQNVRLAAKLLHWKVDITSESSYGEAASQPSAATDVEAESVGAAESKEEGGEPSSKSPEPVASDSEETLEETPHVKDSGAVEGGEASGPGDVEDEAADQ